MSKPIDMTGVKRWKVRYQDSFEILDRFYTLREAEAFRAELLPTAKRENRTVVIVWD